MLYQEILNIDDQIKLNNALGQIGKWCKDWSINSEKKNGFNDGYKEKMKIGLSLFHRYCCLVLIISSDLTWTAYTQHVTRKAMQKLFFLESLASFDV